MKPFWNILCWWGAFTFVGYGYAFPKYRFPIGSLFDPESVQAKTAFQYATERYNNSTNYTFKFNYYEKMFDSSDSYQLVQSMCEEMELGVFLLFGVTNRSLLGIIKDFSQTFEMPFITPSVATKEITDKAPGYIIHMQPLYNTAMVEVMKHYKWTKVFYIYDSEEGLDRLQQMYRTVNNEALKVEIVVVRILDVTDCYEILRNLDSRKNKQNDKYIILDISTEHALQLILRQIQNVGMNRANYHYLLGSLVMDELDLEDFKHGGVNITGFRLVDPEDWKVKELQRAWHRLNPVTFKGAGPGQKIKLDAALTLDALQVVVRGLSDILSKNPEEFRNTFRRGAVYNYNRKGIDCQGEVAWMHGPELIKAFKKVKFDGITGPVEFNKDGYRQNMKLDVMELTLNSEITKIGEWNKDGLKMMARMSKLDPNMPLDEKNKTIIITTIMAPPYIMLRKKPEDGKPNIGNDRYEGYCVDLVENLAGIVGFSYVLKLVDDGAYGVKGGDGTWNGMVGELTRQQADMAVAPLTINSQRERVIDFSKPFMSLGISIMIKKPEKQKPGVFSFMDPLSYEIWVCIIFAYIGVSIVLFLVSRFSPYEWQIEDSVNGPTFTNDFTILNSLWFSLGAFMQQGCDISPRSLSGRIVGSVWWFFTLIIISSYTANLAAFLTVERMLTPIESADDLAKQTEIQYGTLNSGSTKTFFQDSRIVVYQRMWEFMDSQQSVFVNDVQFGVNRVRESKGKYAFLLESTMNDYHNQKKPCNTMKVGGNLDSKGYGVATPLNSPLREPISLAVLQLRESGELQKLHKKWWYDKGECSAEGEGKGSGSSALTLSNVAGIFYILIGGLGLSMVTSLLEFLYKSRIEAMRQQKAFSASARQKTRLSIRGTPERENGGYTYTAPSQIVSLDAYSEGNTHTQV